MKKFWRTISPTQTETITYLALAVIVLVGINLSAIATIFVDEEIFSLGASVFSEKLRNFVSIIDSFSISATFALAFFWAIFGTLVYAFGFTFYELVLETKHDITEASDTLLHHPPYFKHSSFTKTLIVRFAVRIITLIFITIYSAFFIGFMLPLCSQLVYNITYTTQQVIYGLHPVIGILLFALSMHIFIVLIRLLFLRDRLTRRPE